VNHVCPDCDSDDTRAVEDLLIRCLACGAYFITDDHIETLWEPSARNRTRDKRLWNDDDL